MIKGWWWKLLSVVILLTTLIVGLRAPLAPGIESSFPITATSGQTVTLDITGYNTFFKKGENNAWLKFEDKGILAAQKIEVKGDTRLEASFTIPTELPNGKEAASYTLIVDNKHDGAIVLPSAISITKGENITLGEYKPLKSLTGLTQNTNYKFPYRSQLMETIRNTYFHVPMWFSMMILLLTSMITAIMYLATGKLKYDRLSFTFAIIGLIYGILGFLTGMIWAKHTWGDYITTDVKQTMSGVALLIYLAYFVFRSSFYDEMTRNRFSAAYNIFAFLMLIPLLFIIPRLKDSLHPGSGGNPGLGGEDLDHTMRVIFYPAIIGWTLLGVWLCDLYNRYLSLKEKITSAW